MTTLLLEAGSIIKILQVLVVSSLKFFLAPPISIAFGFNYIQTLLITTTGGVIGVLFFYYLRELITRFVKRYIPFAISFFIHHFNDDEIVQTSSSKSKKKKKFSIKSRLIVRARQKFGLFGIAAITPILLSIPLGTFLATKYFHKKRKILVYLTLSVVFWSFIISTVIYLSNTAVVSA